MSRIPPEVSRILYVKNLPYKLNGEELYHIFGRFGAVRQVRIGTAKNTKGSAFVIFDDLLDAKKAMDGMSGFKVGDRYVVVLYYKPSKEKLEAEMNQAQIDELKAQHAVQ